MSRDGSTTGFNTRLYTASRSLAINPCLSPLNPIVHNLEGIGRHSPLPCIVFIAFRSAAAQWAMVTVKLVHRFSTSCARIAPANASNGLTARISSTLFTTCKVISHDCGHTSRSMSPLVHVHPGQPLPHTTAGYIYTASSAW